MLLQITAVTLISQSVITLTLPAVCYEAIYIFSDFGIANHCLFVTYFTQGLIENITFKWIKIYLTQVHFAILLGLSSGFQCCIS